MKLAFIWNFGQAKEIFPNWRDGHRAAIEEVGKVHDVDWYLEDEYTQIYDKIYDFILFWTDATDPVIEKFRLYPARKGIILTSDNNLPGQIADLDVVYCESKPVADRVKLYNKNVIINNCICISCGLAYRSHCCWSSINGYYT